MSPILFNIAAQDAIDNAEYEFDDIAHDFIVPIPSMAKASFPAVTIPPGIAIVEVCAVLRPWIPGYYTQLELDSSEDGIRRGNVYIKHDANPNLVSTFFLFLYLLVGIER